MLRRGWTTACSVVPLASLPKEHPPLVAARSNSRRRGRHRRFTPDGDRADALVVGALRHARVIACGPTSVPRCTLSPAHEIDRAEVACVASTPDRSWGRGCDAAEGGEGQEEAEGEESGRRNAEPEMSGHRMVRISPFRRRSTRPAIRGVSAPQSPIDVQERSNS